MTDAPLDTLDIARRIEALPRDEQEVLLLVLEGAERGCDQYGPLDIDGDRRDFLIESLQESRDDLFYRTAELIRLRRQRG